MVSIELIEVSLKSIGWLLGYQTENIVGKLSVVILAFIFNVFFVV